LLFVVAGRVLIVDDDPVAARSMARDFRTRGWDVDDAQSAEQALELARRLRPSVAVIDLQLWEGGPSGLDLVRALDGLEPRPRLVLVSGFLSVAATVEALHLGADTCVCKPASASELLVALGRARDPDAAATSFEPASLRKVEFEHIDRVLRGCGGNVSEAARRLGIARRSLQRKLRKHPPRY
jgi:two-component system response regulator RegA